jgi:hypothetical protein
VKLEIRPRRALAPLVLVGVVAGAPAWWTMVRMPGANPERAAMTDESRGLAQELERSVVALAADIGPRNVWRPGALHEAEAWVRAAFEAAGYEVRDEAYEVGGVTCRNLWVEVPGTASPEEIVVIGAHYDSIPDCPGANDNGTGVAAVLALAQRLRGRPLERTLRLIAFVNEEPPHFRTADMGSDVHARGCRARGERVVAMMSIETIGYYSDEPGSQSFPVPGLGLLYPDRGDFIVFTSNLGSRKWVRRAVKTFRAEAGFPCEGAALPGLVPGVGWSDQASFWKHGYPGIMVTDTAPFRYPWYHTTGDTPDKVDYERTAQVVLGLERVIADWVDARP